MKTNCRKISPLPEKDQIKKLLFVYCEKSLNINGKKKEKFHKPIIKCKNYSVTLHKNWKNDCKILNMMQK